MAAATSPGISYWVQRGKLDVPKAWFVSYRAATRDGDASLLLGWAGWDHREQAQALAMLISRRRGDDGWAVDRIQPLLAGLAEVLPWVHRWHAKIEVGVRRRARRCLRRLPRRPAHRAAPVPPGTRRMAPRRPGQRRTLPTVRRP